MEFFDLKNISERYLELVNPTTPEKILAAGRVAGMGRGSHVIDFGCGYGEALILWTRTLCAKVNHIKCLQNTTSQPI